MLKIFLALIQNHIPFLKLEINLLLCSCTVRVFLLLKTNQFILFKQMPTVKKTLFLYEVTICGMPQISDFNKHFY